MNELFLFCRAGFESECAAELLDRAAEYGVSGHCVAKPGAGYVRLQTYPQTGAERLHRSLRLEQLIFARQWFVELALPNDLPPQDRVTPLVAHTQRLAEPIQQLVLEFTDTEAGKPMARLARALEKPLREALRAQHRLTGPNDRGVCLHVCLLSTRAAAVGYSVPENSSRWPGGVPRLRFPAAAPSRSTLKLEEAWLQFLTEQERGERLRAGMRAVDLGAAPGGWSWQLAQKGIRVVAVDNGAMSETVLDTGLVTHQRRDGFKFVPEEPVDWMVCDMVEQPIRVAELAARWLAQGWCRQSIFNLKLPMKKRYREVQLCLQRIAAVIEAADVPYAMRCKQLYHDREEVTVYLRAVKSV